MRSRSAGYVDLIEARLDNEDILSRERIEMFDHTEARTTLATCVFAAENEED